MMRYQFGPYFAYFFSGRNDDLVALIGLCPAAYSKLGRNLYSGAAGGNTGQGKLLGAID